MFLPYFCTPFKKGIAKWLVLRELKRIDSVAQLVEQYTFNVWVLGSSPSGITIFRDQIISNRFKALQTLSCRVFCF